MNITEWRLKPRTVEGMETDDAKKLREDGLVYIERLKKDFPNLTVEEIDNKFRIDLDGDKK